MLCCLCNAAIAQKISASINRDKILIGETVQLELKADDIDLSKFTIKQWFIVADTFNHIEITQRGSIDTIKVGSNTGFIQKMQITSFDSGFWQIPAFTIELENKIDGKINLISTFPLELTVLPVDVGNMKDYHDIKDIEEVQIENDWRIIAALAAIALISFFGLLWVLSRKKKNVIQQVAIPSGQTPYDWAIEQIEQLVGKQLVEQQQYKLFYTELIGICRNFSDAQLGLKTSARTTDEYMVLLKGRIGTEPVQVQYFQLLRLSDAVKFAKYIPMSLQNEESIAGAKIFINTLNQFQNS
jgi:hypothetical protein